MDGFQQDSVGVKEEIVVKLWVQRIGRRRTVDGEFQRTSPAVGGRRRWRWEEEKRETAVPRLIKPAREPRRAPAPAEHMDTSFPCSATRGRQPTSPASSLPASFSISSFKQPHCELKFSEICIGAALNSNHEVVRHAKILKFLHSRTSN